MRTILVTGSTDGIGKATALKLATNPENTVIVHGRSKEKCGSVIAQSGGAIKECVVADFADLTSVVSMGKECAERFKQQNVLVCNAGVLLPQRSISKDGFEMTLQVNHLAHFLLVRALMPTLQRNAPSRVVIVSSLCHAWHPLAWDDMHMERDYEKYVQYSRSKLMNAMFGFKLARDVQGTGVTVNVLEPGVIQTKLLAAGGYSGAPVEKGIVASVLLAQSDQVKDVTGAYFNASGRKEQPSADSRDTQAQERLWTVTEEMLNTFL